MTTEEILWNAAFEQEPDQSKTEIEVEIDYSSFFEKFGEYFKPKAL